MGGTRRSTGIRVFEAHVLGRARSRYSPRGQALVPCPTRSLAQSPRRDLRGHRFEGLEREAPGVVQHYGSESLDAANLMMALTFFMSPTDPRMLATLDATLLPLEKGGLTANSLVYRYNINEGSDGLSGEEGTFNICTFWLVEALTRAGRQDQSRLEKARLIFERMLGFANHLGLYAEETGHRGEALGNFPQAFTHLALVSAAFNLDRALGPGR